MAEFLGISDDRLKHVRGVAELMYRLSKELFGSNENQARVHYLLGFNHDVGYRFARDQRGHEWVGGEILGAAGFSFSSAVRYHGEPAVVMNDDLLLLNMCDMLTGRDGVYVTFKERLRDIADRYGEESEQYVRAAQVISIVERELEKRGLTLPEGLR